MMQPIEGGTEFTLDLGMGLPRVWFVSADDTCLIQLQQDRFLFNWRERKEAKYPRYPTVIKRFKTLFAKFERFLKDNELGEPTLIGSEMVYVNVIKAGTLWQKPEDLGEIFPDFSWRKGQRFLPPLEGFNFRTTHQMSGGRLQVAISSMKPPDGAHGIRFDLTARGAAADIEGEKLWQWYDQANTWIVSAFIDLTSKQAQAGEWQRIK